MAKLASSRQYNSYLMGIDATLLILRGYRNDGNTVGKRTNELFNTGAVKNHRCLFSIDHYHCPRFGLCDDFDDVARAA